MVRIEDIGKVLEGIAKENIFPCGRSSNIIVHYLPKDEKIEGYDFRAYTANNEEYCASIAVDDNGGINVVGFSLNMAYGNENIDKICGLHRLDKTTINETPQYRISTDLDGLPVALKEILFAQRDVVDAFKEGRKLGESRKRPVNRIEIQQ